MTVALLLAALASSPESPAARRLAIVVGNNEGLAQDPSLRFAERDARRVAETLRELGGVRGEDLWLLEDQSSDAVLAALDEVDRRSSRGPALLFFFYSGHADSQGLHLAGTTLAWRTLHERLAASRASLRIALIDACQAGALAQAKGVVLGPPLERANDDATGTALIMATQAESVAQESMTLGASYFSHFLVSGLRGAADVDGDGLVTLAEAHAYVTRRTEAATSAWAQVQQRPIFDFDISGCGDIVLTDLRDAAATVSFAPDLEGHVLVLARGSPLIVAEGDTRGEQPLRWALPAGRYTVVLRQADAVSLADVDLPWGGEATIGEGDLSRQSYHAVAQKGGTLDIYDQRLALGAAIQSAPLSGIGTVGLAAATYGIDAAPIALALRVSFARPTFRARDTRVVTSILGAEGRAAYLLPFASLDVVCGLLLAVEHWDQSAAGAPRRESWITGAGPFLGVRLPLISRMYIEADATGTLSRRFSIGGEVDLGILLH